MRVALTNFGYTSCQHAWDYTILGAHR